MKNRGSDEKEEEGKEEEGEEEMRNMVAGRKKLFLTLLNPSGSSKKSTE